jgi:hypothetical protein
MDLSTGQTRHPHNRNSTDALLYRVAGYNPIENEMKTKGKKPRVTCQYKNRRLQNKMAEHMERMEDQRIQNILFR